MGTAFWIVTGLFMLVSLGMVLIILVQRPQGGGLAGAFGGAGGSSTDTVFGGRVGDALTVATVVAFALYLSLAIALNLLDKPKTGGAAAATPAIQAGPGPDTTLPDAGLDDPAIPDPNRSLPLGEFPLGEFPLGETAPRTPPPSTDDPPDGDAVDPDQSEDTTDNDGER